MRTFWADAEGIDEAFEGKEGEERGYCFNERDGFAVMICLFLWNMRVVNVLMRSKSYKH